MSLRTEVLRIASRLPRGDRTRRQLLAAVRGATVTSFKAEFPKVHGYYWSYNYPVTDGVREDTEEDRRQWERWVDQAWKIFQAARRDPAVAPVIAHYMKDYDHLGYSMKSPYVEVDGVSIRTQRHPDPTFIEEQGWTAGTHMMGRSVYTHPDSKYDIVVGGRERAVIIAPA